MAALNSSCYDIAVDLFNPNIIYALYSSGIYKSEDGGSNWVEYRFGNYCYSSGGQISIDPNNSNILYISGYHVYDTSSGKRCMAVYKSTDGGKNWTTSELTSTEGNGYALAIDPYNDNIIYVGGEYYDQGAYCASIQGYRAGLFKTLDGGNNWTEISGPISGYILAIAIDPNSPNKIYELNLF